MIIDTHTHLLPGLDHGCPDLKTAVVMARAAAESGVKMIVCTPHFPEWDPALVQQARVTAQQLKAALANHDLELYVLLGFEVDLSVAVGVDPKRLEELVIERSEKVILFEMPYNGWPLYLEDTIFKLTSEGYTPVLAHPERNDLVQRSSEPLERCVRAGAVVQATAGSLTGEFGSVAVRTFFRLISEGLVSLLATDAHSFRQDNWTMAPMKEALEGRVSPEDWRRLTYTNPLLLLEGKPLERITPLNGGGAPAGWLKKRLGKKD